MVPTREQAIELFRRYNSSDSLFRHALAVDGKDIVCHG